MAKDSPKNVGHIDVAYVAKLARLALSDDEIAAFEKQLDHVLDYVDQIQRVDVTGVEPMAYPIPLRNVLRADEPVVDALDRQDVADNAPRWRDDTFMVPRIIE